MLTKPLPVVSCRQRVFSLSVSVKISRTCFPDQMVKSSPCPLGGRGYFVVRGGEKRCTGLSQRAFADEYGGSVF
jgi:hypothetical protein